MTGPIGTAPGTSAENPFPVRAVAIRIKGWIDRLGSVWVEGQLTQINARNNANTVFMVLRDPAADMSMRVCPCESWWSARAHAAASCGASCAACSPHRITMRSATCMMAGGRRPAPIGSAPTAAPFRLGRR